MLMGFMDIPKNNLMVVSENFMKNEKTEKKPFLQEKICSKKHEELQNSVLPFFPAIFQFRHYYRH